MNVDEVKALATRIRAEVGKAITGQHDTVDLMLTALFAGGHILLEGPPGTAKTMTARCFAQALGVAYGRIQFTPDLMPGDIVGSNIYNFQTGQFTLTRGPIFCDLLLADEINRTPPKTQAALLEAMQEHAVTFDGTTHSLGGNFMVVATQNPIEHQGVYPLPEAQLDRFLFKHRVSYPSAEEERAIIVRHGSGTPSHDIAQYEIEAQTDRATLEAALATVGSVTLVDDVVSYIATLVRAHARERRPRGRSQPALRGDAGAGSTRARRPRRARLRHPRRRQVAGDPGTAPSRHPFARRADRRPPGRADRLRSRRRDGSTALIYPSSRAVWAGAAGAVPAFLVALALPSHWYLGLLWICVLLAFLAVDAAAGRGRASLTASLQAPPQVGVGRQFAVHVDARFAGRPPPGIEARVGHDARLAPLGGTGGALVPDADGGSLDLRLPGLAARHRQLRPAVGALARAVRPGLEAGRAAHRQARWRCCPTSAACATRRSLFLQRDALPDGHAQRRAGQGREFEALKDYQPGMGRRMIDWKRSARHGKLLAREFRVEENNNIVLAIDSGRLMCEPVDGVPKVDRAVTAALLSAFIALKGGDLVSLFSFDSRPRVTSGAVRGSGSFAMIQKRAAEIDYSSEETNFTLALTTLAAAARPALAGRHLHRFRRSDQRRTDAAHRRPAHRAASGAVHDDEGRRAGDTGRHAAGDAEDVARAVIAGGLLRERQVVIGKLQAARRACHRGRSPPARTGAGPALSASSSGTTCCERRRAATPSAPDAGRLPLGARGRLEGVRDAADAGREARAAGAVGRRAAVAAAALSLDTVVAVGGARHVARQRADRLSRIAVPARLFLSLRRAPRLAAPHRRFLPA